MNSDLTYFGSIYVGGEYQYSNKMAYDTGARISILPNDGPFDYKDNTYVEIVPDSDFTYAKYNIDCETAYANFCSNDEVGPDI